MTIYQLKTFFRNYYESKDNSEESTKKHIIVPILELLGWNRDEIVKEYKLDHGRVDIALRINDENKVFVETKAHHVNIDCHDGQLLRYCFSHGVPIAVLTNGRIWDIYSSLGEGDWKDRKVIHINLEKNPESFNTIETVLSKQKFCVDITKEDEVVETKHVVGTVHKILQLPIEELLKLLGLTNRILIRLDNDQINELCCELPNSRLVGFKLIFHRDELSQELHSKVMRMIKEIGKEIEQKKEKQEIVPTQNIISANEVIEGVKNKEDYNSDMPVTHEVINQEKEAIEEQENIVRVFCLQENVKLFKRTIKRIVFTDFIYDMVYYKGEEGDITKYRLDFVKNVFCDRKYVILHMGMFAPDIIEGKIINTYDTRIVIEADDGITYVIARDDLVTKVTKECISVIRQIRQQVVREKRTEQIEQVTDKIGGSESHDNMSTNTS